MNIGIIGIGGRSMAYYNVNEYCNNSKIVCLCDINTANITNAINEFFKEQEKDIIQCTDYQEVMKNKMIDAVIICTPDTLHTEIAIAAIRHGKQVLLEKPITTTFEDLKILHEEISGYDKLFMLGFVLRHTHLYKKVKQLVSTRTIGDVVTIEANETLHRLHAASFFRRWHRMSKTNGGFLNAKCSHDIDLINMIVDEKPLYVSSFGSNIHFVPNGQGNRRCNQCDMYFSCKYVDKNKYVISSIDFEECPYNKNSDIVDHQVLNIEYENGITASFTVCMHSEKGNRKMNIYGTEGTIRTDLLKQEIVVDYIFPKKREIYEFNSDSSNHGGGDEELLKKFLSGESVNEVNYGILSTAIALAAEKSRKEKVVVDMMDHISFLY